MGKRLDFGKYVEGIVINIFSNILWLIATVLIGVGIPVLVVSFIARSPAWTLSVVLVMVCVGLALIVWTQRRKFDRLQRLLRKETYVPLDLGANNLDWIWDHPDLPKGKIWLHSVLFDLRTDGQSRLAGMMVTPSEGNELRLRDVHAEVKSVEAVYVLLNTAFGLRVNPVDNLEWEGRRIGAIHLTFRKGPPHNVPLVLGQNIRDWAPGNQPHAVFRLMDPSAVETWTSADGGSAFDMLQIELPRRPDDLVRISVSAQLEAPQPVQPATLAALQAQVVQREDNGVFMPQLVAREIERSFPQIHILAITCQVAER
jgi:hypothetical protein